MTDHDREDPRAFADQANEAPPGFIKEMWYLLVSGRRWWLAPIVVGLLIYGLLIVLSSTGAAPFIYTLF